MKNQNRYMATLAVLMMTLLTLNADTLPVTSTDLHGDYYLARIDAFYCFQNNQDITSTFPHTYEEHWELDMSGEFQFGFGSGQADVEVNHTLLLKGPYDSVYDGGNNGVNWTTSSYAEYSYPGADVDVAKPIDLIAENSGPILYYDVAGSTYAIAQSLLDMSDWAQVEYNQPEYVYYN